MSDLEQRRKFLLGGVVATGGIMSARSLSAQDKNDAHAGHAGMKMPQPADAPGKTDDGQMQMQMQMEMDLEYPRMSPGVGGPVGSPTDRGKLVAGLRDPSLAPVPIHAPDLKTLPWEMIDGAKEFHLTAEPVRREILPGLWMDTYGYKTAVCPGRRSKLIKAIEYALSLITNCLKELRCTGTAWKCRSKWTVCQS